MVKKETETKIEKPISLVPGESTSSESTSREEVKEQLVSLSKEQLQKLIDDITDLKKTNNVLLQIADKRALSNYQARNRGEIQYDIKIRTIEIDGEEKVVVAWKTEKDRVYKDSDLRWKEEQTTKLFFLDGTTKVMSQYDFNQKFSYIKCKLVGEMRDSVSGEVVLKLLRDDNGEEVEISAPYVN